MQIHHEADHEHDPFVSLQDHEAAKSNDGAGFLYGGGGLRLDPKQQGAGASAGSSNNPVALSKAGGMNLSKAGGNPGSLVAVSEGYEVTVQPEEFGLANLKFHGGANVYIRAAADVRVGERRLILGPRAAPAGRGFQSWL